MINYHNRRFKPVENSDKAETTSDTVFIYKQERNIVTSEYNSQNIISGHLIAIVDDNGGLDMRYHQVNIHGQLMTGTCMSRPEIMKNGKIRLVEKWQWTSGDQSSGSSILEEI